MTARRAVFLDRDGTLIEGEGYLDDPAAVRPVAGAREALEILGEKGWLRVVITNQSGVARGYFTEERYREVESAVGEALPGIDATYACFHLPGGSVDPWNRECSCRKPLPGMILRSAKDLGIELGESVLVGDDVRDLEAARAACVEPILVRTGKGARSESRLADEGLGGVRVVEDLLSLARALPSVREGSA